MSSPKRTTSPYKTKTYVAKYCVEKGLPLDRDFEEVA